VALVSEYHRLEGIASTPEARTGAVTDLLADHRLGCIWLVRTADSLVGYVAVCFGYSIEFGGRDAFIDEFYIRPEFRGRGIGTTALAMVCEKARKDGIAAVHLEVGQDNARAKSLYARAGFVSRDRFHLMTLKSTE